MRGISRPSPRHSVSPSWALPTAALAKQALSQILDQMDLSLSHSLTISTAFNLI